jgi:hypothetical protein
MLIGVQKRNFKIENNIFYILEELTAQTSMLYFYFCFLKQCLRSIVLHFPNIIWRILRNLCWGDFFVMILALFEK